MKVLISKGAETKLNEEFRADERQEIFHYLKKMEQERFPSVRAFLEQAEDLGEDVFARRFQSYVIFYTIKPKTGPNKSFVILAVGRKREVAQLG